MTIAEITMQVSEPAFYARARLRAQWRVAEMRRRWAAEAAPGGGLVITDAEVDRILGGPEIESPIDRSVADAITRADAEFDLDTRWQRLRQVLGLTAFETDLLNIAVAVAFDPWFRRACAYLHDDATVAGATPWLTAQLFGYSDTPAALSGSSLDSWRLAATERRLLAGGPAVPWLADPQIAAWLTRTAPLAAGLDIPVQLVANPEPECLHGAALEEAAAFIGSIRGPIEIELRGPAGSGKRTLAAQIAAASGRTLLVASLSDLRGGDAEAAADAAIRLARTARIAGAVLCVAECEGFPAAAWRALCARTDLLFIATEAAAPPAANASRKTIALGAISRSARIALWERLAATPAPAPVAQWSLTAGEIAAAARVAPAGEGAVAGACTRMLHHDLPDLLIPMPLPFAWEDIVLPPHLREELRELEQRIRFRGDVYDDWGFGRLVPFTRGVTAMFAGPSGTGKTMAAQVLARAAGLPLYRVDLSGVVNKYIGETEKRLKRVFDACERADAILLFDEADALFGQRMQVREAHDRFANIEIDYLLQRMEQFEGIAVLATNRKNDLDSAFLRRLRVVIDFLPPARGERLELWRRALPERSPSGEDLLDDIDANVLADRLNTTGAEIQAIALGAAFRARTEGTRIAMRHVIASARRELIKRGAVLRGEGWES